VVYAFLERADAVVMTTFERTRAGARGGALGGDRASTRASSCRCHEFTCAGCPALDVVCAGPRLRDGGPPVREAPAVPADRR
jgi:hypothetical protein